MPDGNVYAMSLVTCLAVACAAAGPRSTATDGKQSNASGHNAGPAHAVRQSPPPDPVARSGDEATTPGLPCAGPDACPHRARFAPSVTLYAGGQSKAAFAADTPRTHSWRPHGRPRVANPDHDTDSRTHVVCSSEQITTEVFVDAADLLPVVTDFVLATPTKAGDRGSPAVGVSLVPGAAVELQREQGLHAKVRFEEEVVEGWGWIPKSVIGRTFVYPQTDPRALPNRDRIQVRWEDAAPVLDRPGGRPLARISGPATIQPLGETQRGHTLGAISFVLEDRTYAIGWIADAAVESGQRRGGVVGGVVAGMPAADATRVTLTAGTNLHTEQGERIAVTTDDITLECLSDCGTETPLVQVQCVGTFPARVTTKAKG